MKDYEPTYAQRQIMNQMSCYPETCKTIASRMTISRQNVSQQCRIMADNDVIERHGRGKFSLKSKHKPTFKDLLDCERPTEIAPKKLQKKAREETSIEAFSKAFPDHLRWLVSASSRGNSFAQSLLSQLRKGWALTVRQMHAIEKNLYAR